MSKEGHRGRKPGSKGPARPERPLKGPRAAPKRPGAPTPRGSSSNRPNPADSTPRRKSSPQLRKFRWFVIVVFLATGGLTAKRVFWPATTKEPPRPFQSRTIKGKRISLAQFRGKRNVVLIFYRGSFSSTSTNRLRALQANHQNFRSLGAEVIAVTTESRSLALQTAIDLRLSFPVISSLQLTDLYETYDAGTLMTSPAAFLLDKGGNIRWKHIGRGPLDWPRVPRILKELRKL